MRMPTFAAALLAVVGTAVGDPPVVDLRTASAAAEMVDAARDWGFAYVTGHGIPDDVTHAAADYNERFFRLPAAAKDTLLADKKPLKTARGYAGIRGEQLDVSHAGQPDLKEVLDVGLAASNNTAPHLGVNMWPAELPGLRGAIEGFAGHASGVAERVVGLLGEGLGHPGVFASAFADPLRVQRLTRYPPATEVAPAAAGEVSCGTHSDYGGVTVLHAAGDGLLVLRPNRTGARTDRGTFFSDMAMRHSGEWVAVPPRDGSFVVMFGEALQRMSNGAIHASKHRVENTLPSARHSLAFFYDPSPDCVLEPLQALRGDLHLPLYTPKVAGHKGVPLPPATESSPVVGSAQRYHTLPAGNVLSLYGAAEESSGTCSK